MKSKTLLILMIALAVVAITISIFFLNREAIKEISPSATLNRAEIPAELTGKRGSRPTESRLPSGAQQIEDRTQALAVAQESLANVEKQLSSATDHDKRAALERKKQLIEKAIERLERN